MHGFRSTNRLSIDILLIFVVVAFAIVCLLPYIAPGASGAAATVLGATVLAFVAGLLIYWRCARRACEKDEATLISDRGSTLRSGALSLVILGVGVPGSIVTAGILQDKIEANSLARFRNVVERSRAEFSGWMYRPIYAMKGTRALFASSERVQRSEYRGYSQDRNPRVEFPGMLNMAFAPRVDNGSMPGFVAAQQADGWPSYQAEVSQTGSWTWPVQFIEPAEAYSDRLGVNIMDSEVIRSAIDLAIESGEPSLAWMPGLNGHDPLHLAWVMPVYGQHAAAGSPAERRGTVEGVLISEFDAGQLGPLLEQSLGGMAGLTVRLVGLDRPLVDGQLIACGGERAAGTGLEQGAMISMGGKKFALSLVPTAAYMASVDRTTPVLAAAVGIALSVTLAAFCFNLGSSRRRAILIAESMLGEVRRLSAVAECTNNAVVITDADQRVVWVNDSFVRITGCVPEETIGRPYVDLLEGDGADAGVLSGLRSNLERGEGFRGEILGRGKDGRGLCMGLDVQPVRGEDGVITEFVAVAWDLTEQKEAERRMREALAAAESANEAKSRFLSGMSHEIRTPLNGIIGFADLLRRGAHAGDMALKAEWIGIIHSSGQHLLALLNDVLDLSKLDAEQVDVTLAPCDPRSVISGAVLLLDSRAKEQGIGLDVEFEDSVPHAMRSDATRIRQIVMNLVSNAVKFTHRGSVDVRVSSVGEGASRRLRVAVRDTGIGMCQEQASKLFAPFQQADRTIAEDYGGTGLGLSISRGLARRLGGDISVASAPGVGSCFTLEIEAPPLLAGEGLPSAKRDGGVSGDGTAAAERPLSGMHVLVADDVLANRQVAQIFLRQAGAEVSLAVDGVEAVDACGREDFDLILMDIQMPKLSGIGATRMIREQGAVMPILALTAFSSGADRASCLGAGMNDFLSKPFEPAVLIQAAARWVRHARDGAALPTRGLDSEQEIDPELLPVAMAWLDALTEQLDAIERAIDASDSETVQLVGHAIKGSGGTLGFPAFTEPAVSLEKAGNAGDFAEVRRLLGRLRSIQSGLQGDLAA